MVERRYDDKEIAAIFRAAAETPPPPSPQREVPQDEGLTLADLQAIGREVGIAPDAIAHAARGVDVRPGGAAARMVLGLPIGVSRTVQLNRRLTDEEWERFVVQLREVFNARGRTRSDGALRQWTNGNLHVLLEPTEAGHRLRFGTLHGAASAWIGGGFAALGIGAATAAVAGFSGALGEAVYVLGSLAVVGIGMIVSGALRLPRWARLRSRQMEALAAQAATTSSPPKDLDNQVGPRSI